MLSKIRPKSHQRYISLPLLGSILDEFTVWSHKRGYTIGTIRNQLRHTVWIDKFLRRRGAERLDDLTQSSFETAWNYYRHRDPETAGTTRQIERFLDEIHGLVPLPPTPMTSTASKLNCFAEYLQSVHGFAISTIRSYIRCLQEFLEYISYDINTNVLTSLTSKEIEKFLCLCAKRLNRYTIQHVVGYLRRFLRFEYDGGVLQRPLHTEIDTPRVYRLEKLPHSLTWEMVEDLLNSVDRTNPYGIRDYTILYLIITYGLRTSEIVSLTLDDIDWRASTIRIHQRKTNNQRILPLTDEVGKALIEYLKKSRPNLPYRELFLRVRAPSGILKPTAVTEIFQLRVRRSGLDIPYHGPHCLRHSYAVHLLRQGTSLKSIGDLMGHRTAESTCTYLRLAVEDLRSVALPAPQGSIINTPLEIIVSDRWLNTKYLRKARNLSDNNLVHKRIFLTKEIQSYMQLNRALGRNYITEACTLRSLDTFIANYYPQAKDLTAEMFDRWCVTLNHLSSTTRRSRMLHVRKFCLYRCRSHPHSFIPDILTFPAKRQPPPPYIFSETDIARILSATQYLSSTTHSPIRSQTFYIAILLLHTTGLRRGELLRLRLGNYNLIEKTLLIQETKFHKSRIIPLHSSVAAEVESFLALRLKNNLPTDVTSSLIWNRFGGPEGKNYTGTVFRTTWCALCAALGIFTKTGRTPRIHDLRHSFAINVLNRWYQTGENVQVKLPMLSTYMGHISIDSTSYYLPFIDSIRSEASMRFQQSYGSAVNSNNGGV